MKVRIYKPHTHAGKRYNPPAEGIEIEMDEHDIKWLDANTDVLKPPAPSTPAPIASDFDDT